MSIEQDREFLKNLSPLQKVQFLVKRKMMLKARLSNMPSKRRLSEKILIQDEVKMVEQLIEKYR